MERKNFYLNKQSKKQTRLQFTEEERADPTLEKPIAKAEKRLTKQKRHKRKSLKKR